MTPAERPAPLVLDAALAAGLVPRRDPTGHKGTFGRVALVAGSLDYAGAALLAGAAALRAGAGLATLYVPSSLQRVVAGRVPELITHGLAERTPGEADPAAARATLDEAPHDALVIGPGLMADRSVARLVTELLSVPGPPAVVDAGALAALALVPGWWRLIGRPCVLTPHPGEFARLDDGRIVDPGDRVRVAEAAAIRWGHVVVLKGAGTVVAPQGGRTLRAPFELPLLASGGTGDVLAGVIGGLLAQGLAPADAAALGVYLHGAAGEGLGERLGDAGLLASDLLEEIPRVRRRLVAGASGRAGGRSDAPGSGSRRAPARATSSV